MAEVGAVADQHGALQHVAVAERRPGIAYIVGAAEHLDAMLAKQLERRNGRAAGTVAHDRDARAGERVGRAGDAVGRDRAQGEGVADRDLAPQAGRLRALGDREDLREAGFAAIVQMDVDANATAVSDGEDGVEMGVEVAVDADRVETTHQIRALSDRLVEQLRRAGRAQDAALGEGHDLDGDEIAEMLADLQDLMKVAKPELVVDVDMRAHVQGAAGHDLAHQVRAGLELRHGARRAYAALGLDPVRHLVAGGLIGHPRQAEQRLVEMDVAVDQRRQHESSRQIDGVRCRWRSREEGGDPPSLDLDVAPAAVGQRGIRKAHASARLTWRPSGRLPCA